MPSNRYANKEEMNKFEEAKKNRQEFLKKHGSPDSALRSGFNSRKMTENPADARYNQPGPRLDLDGQNISYDTYGIYQEDSVSQNNPVAISTISHDDEKLESLLERLEESRVPEKGFTMQEKNMIIEDTQYLATLSKSETLYKIFQLM